ncbi:MAG: hypothetical protein ACRDNB_00870 [Gaiellaceae bacterium]
MFLSAVTQVARFVDNVAIDVPVEAASLASEAEALVAAIRGHDIPLIRDSRTQRPDVTLIVGSGVPTDWPAIAINSSGWVARMITSAGTVSSLPTSHCTPNAVGARGAACLGVGQIFGLLTGRPLASAPFELSFFERRHGALGTLDPGPPLPTSPLPVDALFVGCGGVMHGLLHTLRHLPVAGRAMAVDRQRLRDENLGPYVESTIDLLDTEKAEIVKRLLGPTIEVKAFPEDFDPLFTVRLERGLITLPPIVIAGLDRVTTRHTVQRLWPDVLIDLGAGGETAQVILKRRREPGACVLELLDVPPEEEGDLTRLANESGLAPNLVQTEMDMPITAADVAAAPRELREALEEARKQVLLRCGFIRARALDHEAENSDFAAAAPHVVGLAGVTGAAELTKELMGISVPGSLRFQFSFVSNRARTIRPARRAGCECEVDTDAEAA